MNKKLTTYVKLKFMKAAEDLVQNPGGLKVRLNKAKEKLNKDSIKGALGNYVEDLLLMMRMISAWGNRKYTDISPDSLIYIVLAIIYFVTPTDFIPDFLLGLGFVDDMAVIAWVLEKIKKDKEGFKKWEKENSSK